MTICKIELLEDVNNMMPWFVALLIGVLTTVTNIFVMRKSMKVNKDIAELNFNSNVLSKNRQEWINTLRDLISEYIAIFDNILLNNIFNKEDKSEVKYIRTKEGKEEIRNLFYLQNKIGLLLNLKEGKSKSLYMMLTELTAAFHKDIENVNSYQEKANDCFLLSQEILKEEWVRVKNGK